MTDPAAELESFAESRTAYVAGPTGNLALVSYVPVGAEWVEVPELSARARLIEGAEAIELVPAGSSVSVDGQPVRESATVGRLQPDGTPIIDAGRYKADLFSLDGSDYELRIYDAQSPNLARFEKIDRYEYSPEWVLRGTFRQYADTEHVPWGFTRESDTGHEKKVPGVIAVDIDGASYELAAFLDGPALVLVFADATTGSQTYAPGRFLRLPDPADDGSIEVDFNRAIVPPCGFSDFYSCPIPPAQNRISAAVTAGEKKAVWKD